MHIQRILLLGLICCAPATLSATELPHVTHYSLQVRLFPGDGRLEAVGTMTVTNKSTAAASELPFLLYRLLEVTRVDDGTGAPLKFSQTITRLAEPDDHNLQLNLVRVQLAKPLLPGATTNLTITYAGSIYGYSEIWQYVKDRIGEQYSLFRPDSLAYPMLAEASHKSLLAAYGFEVPFTYDVNVTVPAGYVVACGGAQQTVGAKDGLSTFVFKSKIPTWRIDIAAANFKIVKDESKKLFVYVLPPDQKAAPAVLDGVSRAVKLYSDMFGALPDYQGYTVIEIPDGWGSQASDFYLMQVASTFADTQHLAQLYHEVAHSWNAKAKPEFRRTRWFDEAFAMYFQALAIREFEGEKAYRDEMDRDREIFIKRVQRDKRNFDTPIADYGKVELGGNSYTKGAWSLYVLHQLVGEEQFRLIMRAFLSEFREQPADFKDFQRVAERISGRDLSKYFNEWIYEATSSQLLSEKILVTDIAKRY